MTQQIEKFQKNQPIFLQGESYDYLYHLLEGGVSFLMAGSDYDGIDGKLILSHSLRVHSLSEKSVILPLKGVTVIAASECSCTRVPFGGEGIPDYVRTNPAKAITMLVCLFRLIESCLGEADKLAKLERTLATIADNLMIVFKELSGRSVAGDLQAKIDNTHRLFFENGGQLPQEISGNFISDDHGPLLGKGALPAPLTVDKFYDKKNYDFYKRLTRVTPNILGHLFNSDAAIPLHIYSELTGIISALFSGNFKATERITSLFASVFGEKNSVYAILFNEGAANDLVSTSRLKAETLQQLAQLTARLYASATELTGRDFTTVKEFSGKAQIEGFIRNLSAVPAQSPTQAQDQFSGGESATISSPPLSNEAMALYNNSLNQILEFAVMGNDFRKELLTHLNDFKKMENPFDGENDSRKLRRQITNLYWTLYNQVYIRTKKAKTVPMPVKLMLQYGFLDEKLLEEGQLPVLHRFAQDKYKPNAPIVYEYEFLSRIYAAKDEPSVNEMGLTYEKNLREMTKTARKGEDPSAHAREPNFMVEYEINNMLHSTTSIVSGSRSTAFPILCSQLVKGDPAALLVTKSKLEKTFTELVESDYSAFYRETVFKINEAREVIEEEIWPYLIILPVAGTKTMMWQEIVGTNKRSRARIVIPAFFSGDLTKSLAHTLAVFRWELTRTTKGGLWSDPVEGGITGAYNDYIQFFKKNSKLSVEAKQKIAERLRSLRNNVREVFAEDYVIWQTYERDGIMKMNAIARDIFYRYVPFKKEVRDNLAKLPAFADCANRFKNIRARTFGNFDRKFKKYQAPDGKYPPEIEKFLNYLQM